METYAIRSLDQLLRRSPKRSGGDKGSRTPDLLLARQALSQLSYAPIFMLLQARVRALKIE